MDRQLALTVSVRGTLERKLLEATRKGVEQKVALDAANTQIADLKAQLTKRIAAEEAEQKRRIDAEEEKAILSVQLEAARGAKLASEASLDNSDLDTYRVSFSPIFFANLTEDRPLRNLQ